MAGNGFSFVEALSSCPTNWRTNAEETWKYIEEVMPKFFKIGEIKVPGKGRETGEKAEI
jgi:2-oxoglutarate ferredoxin oxidoreductase subunit beta